MIIIYAIEGKYIKPINTNRPGQLEWDDDTTRRP